MTNTAAFARFASDPREHALALDLLDESPVDYLWEDDRGKVEFLNDLDQWDPAGEWMTADEENEIYRCGICGEEGGH